VKIFVHNEIYRQQYNSVYVLSSLSHTASHAYLYPARLFLYVHCQFCVSTVSISTLLIFTPTLPHMHTANVFTLRDHLVCPLSVLSVHCQYMSTVHFQTHAASYARSQCFTLLVHSVCPLSLPYIHCQCTSWINF